MEKKPLVSVTMPVYNGEPTIQLAINSLLRQTFQNWKCIIVNDRSTDGTASILKKYESDIRFKIIHLPVNMGRGNARQVALENAEGDYLAFLDADDFYHPEKLELQIKAFNSYPNIVVCSTGVGSFNADKRLVNFRGVKYSGYHKSYKDYYFPGLPASIMIKLEIAKKQNYDVRLDVGEDNNFIRKCLLGGNYFIINQILYYYEEVGTISKQKFIGYQLELIKTVILTFKGASKISYLIVEICKLIYKIIYVNVFSVNQLVLKRGASATKNQTEVYKKVLINLNYKNDV